MNQRLIPIVCLTFLTACAGNAVKDSESIHQSAIQQAKATEQDPQTVITETQNLQVEAQKEDLYFFSPSYMEQAEDALEDAEEAIKSKKLPHEVIAHALTAQKLFKRGLENKPTVLKQLKASFDGIQMLRDIQTDKILISDFQEIQDNTKELIILIEQGKATEAIKEQKDLLSDITELEIKTLMQTYLTVAENALDKAEDADADDFAGKSFSQAQKTVENLEKFIRTSPKERNAIKEKSKIATHISQHAENVAKASQPLLKLTPETAEDHILYIEKLMARIATALNQNDILNLNLNSQSIAIAQAAETINKRAITQTQISAQVTSWEIEKANLLLKIENLEKSQVKTIEDQELPAATNAITVPNQPKAEPDTQENDSQLTTPTTTTKEMSTAEDAKQKDTIDKVSTSTKNNLDAKEPRTIEVQDATEIQDPPSSPKLEKSTDTDRKVINKEELKINETSEN